jgi:hypothetical protein
MFTERLGVTSKKNGIFSFTAVKTLNADTLVKLHTICYVMFGRTSGCLLKDSTFSYTMYLYEALQAS